MPTVAEIERLTALAQRLLPLTSRARGEVIAADDWNTVVGALLEVARAVVSSAGGTEVPVHEHLDQVSMAWLAPQLRQLVERGPLADPGATGRVGAVERALTLSTQRLDQLTAQLRDVRVATTRQEANDLDRSSALTRLTRQLDGLADPRDEVSTLRSSLDAIRSSVEQVSAFAAGLDNLTPAQVRAGLSRVDDLEARLTTPTGALLDAAEFERRLTQLSTTLVTEAELTDAIAQARPRIPDDLRAGLLEESRAAAQRQAESSTAAVADELRAQISTRLDQVRDTVAEATRAAAGQFRDEVRADLEGTMERQLTQALAGRDDAVRGLVADAVGAATAAVRTAIEDRVSGLEAGLADRVGGIVADLRPQLLTDVDALVTERLTGVDGRLTERIAGVDARLAAVDAGLGDVRGGLGAVGTDIATVKQAFAAALDAQLTTVRGEFDTALTGLTRELRQGQDRTVEDLRAELAAERLRVDTQLETVRQQIPPVVRGVTVDELNAALTNAHQRIRSDILGTVDAGLDARIDGRLVVRGGGIGPGPFVPPGPFRPGPNG